MVRAASPACARGAPFESAAGGPGGVGERLGERGVRVDGPCQVLQAGGRLHGEGRLRDEVGGGRPGQVHAEHDLAVGVGHDLHQAVRFVEGHGPAVGREAGPADDDPPPGGPCAVRFREPDGAQLRIGEGEQRHELVEGRRQPAMASAATRPSSIALWARAGPAVMSPDGEDRRDGRPPLGVDGEAPVGAGRQAGVAELEVIGVGHPAHGHEHAIGVEPAGARPPSRRSPPTRRRPPPDAGQHLDPVVRQAIPDDGHEIGVEADQDRVERLHDR